MTSALRQLARALVVATPLVIVTACAASPGERMRADVTSFQSEQTPNKLFDRGRGFAAVGDMTRAEEYFAAAINAGMDERKVMPLLLEVCTSDHRYRVAISYAEPYLRKHPSDVSTRFVLGTLYAAVGDVPQAKSELEKVVAARPNEPNAHYALAIVSRDHDNDLVGADRHFREYLKLAPKGPHAEEARASLLKEVPQPSN